MKSVLCILALFLTSCLTLPPNAGIDIPVGDPVVGVASIRRVADPNGTQLGFKTLEPIGNDQVALELKEDEVIVTVYDSAFGGKEVVE